MNDQHVPVRQMLMLCVNILLGDGKRRDHPLLTCTEARKRKPVDVQYSNPFNNAVGLNIRDEKRRAITVFAMLEIFGIGYETDNALDSLLMAGSQNTNEAILEQVDPFYGRAIFATILDGHNRGEVAAEKFNAALEAQRRRLFFLLGNRPAEAPSPWYLTIFHYAGEYLALSGILVSGDDETHRQAVVERLLRQLVKGLNRTLTGMMVEDSDSLWLARSIGRSEGTVGRFTMLSAVKRRAAGQPLRVNLSSDAVRRRPQVTISHRAHARPVSASTPLDLRPLMFEYLMRVADGSLPSSFSRQCQQEVRHFALAASAFVESFLFEEEDRPVQILSVTKDGAVSPREIGI